MKNVALEGRWECSCFSCFLRPFPPFAEKGCSHYTTYDIYPFPNPPYLIAIIITVIYLFVFRFLSLPHPETLKIQVSHADAVLQIKTNQNQNPSKHNPTRITQALIFNDVHVHATHTLGPYIPPLLCISTPFPDAIQTKQRYSSYSPHTQNPYIIIIPFNIYIYHHTLVCAY